MATTSRGGRDLVCQQVVELVTDYLEDALTPDDRRRLEAHLTDCPHCGVYLAQIRRTIQVVGLTGDRAVEPRVRAELLRLYRGWIREAG